METAPCLEHSFDCHVKDPPGPTTPTRINAAGAAWWCINQIINFIQLKWTNDVSEISVQDWFFDRSSDRYHFSIPAAFARVTEHVHPALPPKFTGPLAGMMQQVESGWQERNTTVPGNMRHVVSSKITCSLHKYVCAKQTAHAIMQMFCSSVGEGHGLFFNTGPFKTEKQFMKWYLFSPQNISQLWAPLKNV